MFLWPLFSGLQNSTNNHTAPGAIPGAFLGGFLWIHAEKSISIRPHKPPCKFYLLSPYSPELLRRSYFCKYHPRGLIPRGFSVFPFPYSIPARIPAHAAAHGPTGAALPPGIMPGDFCCLYCKARSAVLGGFCSHRYKHFTGPVFSSCAAREAVMV